MSIFSKLLNRLTGIPEQHLTPQNIDSISGVGGIMAAAKPDVENWITTRALRLPIAEQTKISAEIAAKIGVAPDLVSAIITEAEDRLSAYAVSQVDSLFTHSAPAPVINQAPSA